MTRSNWKSRFLKSKMFVLLILYLLLIAVFSIISRGQYLSWFNIRNIMNSMVVTAYLTCGASFLMIAGNVDLSTAQVALLSGAMLGTFLQMGFPWPAAILAVFIVAAAAGALNAMLINEIKFQPFVATMAVSYVVQGLMLVRLQGFSIDVDSPPIVWFGTYKIGGVLPVSIIFTFAIFAVYGVVLAKTKFGKSLYLVGGNPTAAKLAGLNPKRISYILFINNAVLGSFAGMLQAARLKAATPNAIANGMFAGMTGAILGGISFGGGSGGMGGAFVGLILLNGFNAGLSTVGLSPYWQTAASGALLLLALTFDYFNSRRLSSIKVRNSGRVPGVSAQNRGG
ncbi:MAG: ABC transporter permease [Oscillospiraceae bacterium]|jgi:ribose/xylose/arabinose/galactoside ABC-type transport system permease subunit|nr:ABC transporter permease [Oscillospiraceae bacterium]